MSAAVPDPRFRDQLAEKIDEVIPDLGHGWALGLADLLMPAIAAEVEARVQAAANQRAAEAEGAVIRAVQLAQQWEINAQSSRDVGVAAVALVAASQLRAALASPAPALDAEAGS